MISTVGKDDRAFTLLELLVVLMILGLASFIVLPSLERGLRDTEVRRSALGVAAAARDLRSRALQGSAPERLVFDPRENSYRVSDGGKVFLSSDVKIAGIEGGEPVGDGLRQFLFFPNGALLGGEVEVAAQKGYPAYVVRLDPLTGRIVVARGAGS